MQKLHINGGNLLFSKSDVAPVGSIIFDVGSNVGYTDLKWSIQYVDEDDFGFAGLNLLNTWYGGGVVQYTYSLFLDNLGNVGIGNRNPQAKLDVSGSFKAQNANITGAFSANTLNAQSANITGNTYIS